MTFSSAGPVTMDATNPGPAVPEGHRVYAIGDIHGRLDLLDQLHARILADTGGQPVKRGVVVYLGDYLSRGPHSRGVIDRLRCRPLPDLEQVCLKGNHEDLLLRFLGGELRAGRDLLNHGGGAALESYGVEVPGARRGESVLATLRDDLEAALQPPHLAFLDSLKISHTMGDYFFVHAGVRPGVALVEQSAFDMMWIRRRFLDSRADHGRMVVHGHSITSAPEVYPNRIGIDTGASRSGVLTCLALSGTSRRFLQTA